MTRFAAVLAAAALATSGCIITTDDPGVGSVTVYWDFLRYAPDAPGASASGFILYDEDLVGTGNSSCPESGVESVDVTSPNGTLNFPCTYAGVQGVTLDGLPEGNVTLRVKGWRRDGIDRVLWDGAIQVNVLANRTVEAYVDVDPVSADLDVVAYLSYGTNQFYATCAEAANPEIDYELYDSLGTLVLRDTVLCPGATSAFPVGVIASTMDLDTYTIRLQGFTGATPTRTFDSCTGPSLKFLAFDHYDTHIGANAIDLDMFTPPKCAP